MNELMGLNLFFYWLISGLSDFDQTIAANDANDHNSGMTMSPNASDWFSVEHKSDIVVLACH